MTEMPSTKTPEFAMADAQFAVCQRIEEFIGSSVRPILERTSNGDDDHQTYIGAILRVHAWLRTLGKLNHPGDFQAVLSASRSLFEIAVDLTLMKFDPTCPCAKLRAWEESAKYHSAERLARFCKDHPSTIPAGSEPVLSFLKQKTRILALRNQFWNGDRHPTRWTGRKLDIDAAKSDKLRASGFQEYYDARHAQVCWNVHGSGLTGVRTIPAEHFPAISALGFIDASAFALIACERALQLMDRWDAISISRFENFRKDLVLTQASVLSAHGARVDGWTS